MSGHGKDVRLVVQQGSATSGFAVTSWATPLPPRSANIYFYNDAQSAKYQALSDFGYNKETFTDISDQETTITAQVTNRDQADQCAHVALGFQTGYEKKGTSPLPTKASVEVRNNTSHTLEALKSTIAPGQSSKRTFDRPARPEPMTSISVNPADPKKDSKWTLVMGMPSNKVGSLLLERDGTRGSTELGAMNSPERRLLQLNDRHQRCTVDRQTDQDGCVRIIVTVDAL